MKTMFLSKKVWLRFAGISMILVLAFGSCKKKAPGTEQYINAITEVAKQYQQNCPKQLPNNTTIESVEFSDSAKVLTFRMTLTDEAIATINLDNARDSIINGMSDKLKLALVKAECDLEYKYVSPNDSSIIRIIPNELGTIPEGEEKTEK